MNRRSLFLLHVGVLLLFTGLAIFSYRKILFTPGGIAPTNEWLFPVLRGQFVDWVKLTASAWRPWELGQASPGTSGFYWTMFLSIPSLLGMPAAIVGKFFIVVLMVGGGYGAFYLSRQLKLGAIPSLLAGLAYMLSPLFYDRIVQGHLVTSFAIFPWVIAFFYRSLEERRLKFLLAAGLLTAIADLTLPFLTFTFLALLLLSLVRPLGRDLSFRRGGAHLGLWVVVSSAVHSVWLLVQVFLFLKGDLSGDLATAIGQFPISFYTPGDYVTLDYTLRLVGFHGGFFISTAKDIGRGWWPGMSYLVPILAFGALLLRPRDWRALYFSLLAIAGILLASANLGPLGSAWLWLMEKFPYMMIFKETYKWMNISILGYALLIGLTIEIGLRFLTQKWATWQPSFRNLAQPTSVGLVFFAVSGLLLGAGAPYLTGNSGGYLLNFQYGKQYEQLWRWGKEDPEDYRVLWLPTPHIVKFKGLSKPSYDVMGGRFSKPVLYEAKYYSAPFTLFLFKTLYDERTENLAQLLGIANVGYAIFDQNKEPVDPAGAFSNTRLYNTLSQQPGLEPVRSWDGITLYKNKEVSPHIFAVKDIALLAGDLDSLVSLTYSDQDKLKETGIVFVSQLSPEDIRALSRLPGTEFIIQDGHFPELALALAQRKYQVDPVQYFTATNPSQGWTLYEWLWYKWYTHTPLKHAVFTSTSAALTIPLSMDKGIYEIFLKAYHGPLASSLELSMNGQKVGRAITTSGDDLGFRWTSLGETKLETGGYNLKIESETGENFLTDIVLVEREALQEAMREAQELMDGKKVTVLAKSSSFQLPLEPVWGKEAQELARIAANRVEFFPKDLNFRMALKDDVFSLTLGFSRPANVAESLYFIIPVDGVDLAKAPFMSLQAKVDRPERQNILFHLALDTDGDGKQDILIRSYEIPELAARLRGGLSTEFGSLVFDLLSVAKAAAPGKPFYRVLSLELGFLKIGDITGAAVKDYNFYIKDLQFLAPQFGASSAEVKPTSQLESAAWRLNANSLARVKRESFPEPGGPLPAQAGLSYQIMSQEDSTKLSLEFSRPANVEESLYFMIPVDGVDLNQAPILRLQASADRPERQEIRFRLFIDTDGDGKQDTILRSHEVPELAARLRDALKMFVKRQDFDLQKVAREVAPGKPFYRVLALELGFKKIGDMTGSAAGSYNFYVGDIGFLKSPPQEEIAAETWASQAVGVKASHGTALMAAAPAVPISVSLYAPASGDYKLSLRARTDRETARLWIKVGSHEFEVSPGREFSWNLVGQVSLTQGPVEVIVEPQGKGRVYLDQLALVSDGTPSARSLPIQITSQKLHYTRYKIQAQSQEPFYLVFSERYDPGWRLHVKGGPTLQSYPAYSFGNLFFVDRTGVVEMTLEFDRQGAYTLTQRISFSAVGLLLLLLITPGRVLTWNCRRLSWLCKGNFTTAISGKLTKRKEVRHMPENDFRKKLLDRIIENKKDRQTLEQQQFEIPSRLKVLEDELRELEIALSVHDRTMGVTPPKPSQDNSK